MAAEASPRQRRAALGALRAVQASEPPGRGHPEIRLWQVALAVSRSCSATDLGVPARQCRSTTSSPFVARTCQRPALAALASFAFLPAQISSMGTSVKTFFIWVTALSE